MVLHYSPVYDDAGAINGLFCVTAETTDRVLGEAALRESEDHYRHAVELKPAGALDLRSARQHHLLRDALADPDGTGPRRTPGRRLDPGDPPRGPAEGPRRVRRLPRLGRAGGRRLSHPPGIGGASLDAGPGLSAPDRGRHDPALVRRGGGHPRPQAGRDAAPAAGGAAAAGHRGGGGRHLGPRPDRRHPDLVGPDQGDVRPRAGSRGDDGRFLCRATPGGPGGHAPSLRLGLDPALRATYDVEYRTIGRNDGRMRWVAAKGRGVFDGSGRCVRALGTTVDITARKSTRATCASRSPWRSPAGAGCPWSSR